MDGLDPGLPAGLAADASDGALARRVALGDPGAEEELCRRLRPRLRLYGLRQLRDEAAAADLVQDALLVLLGRLRAGGLRDPERLASFVLSTCRRLVVGAARTARRRAALLAAGAAPADASPPPAEPIPRDRLAGCLEGLGDRERAVVLATFYAEQPTDAIARDHGLSCGNVRVLRHRALRRLRACLGLEGAAP